MLNLEGFFLKPGRNRLRSFPLKKPRKFFQGF
jgi:hypothetical protein